MVSVVIMSVAVATAVQLSNIALSGGRGNASAEVRNLIRRDLNWLRWYAKAWRCTHGCTPATANSRLNYTAGSCADVADDFLTAANDHGTKPFDKDVEVGTQNLPSVNGISISRTIAASGSNLLVTYTYAGQPPLERFSSVLIQAGQWCT